MIESTSGIAVLSEVNEVGVIEVVLWPIVVCFGYGAATDHFVFIAVVRVVLLHLR